MIGRYLVYALLGLPILFLVLHTIIRIVRHFFKFPMPQFMANAIDNPLRRKIQPPDATAIRHGIEPGMTVLEVGPGNGRYSIAAAKRLGANGRLVTIDIEPKMLQRVRARIEIERVTNTAGMVADVHQLPFQDGQFDLIYMIAVIGEIPRVGLALGELHRVLSERGVLVFSELLMDPDYPLANKLTQTVELSGFRLTERIGNFFYYTLKFTPRPNGLEQTRDAEARNGNW